MAVDPPQDGGLFPPKSHHTMSTARGGRGWGAYRGDHQKREETKAPDYKGGEQWVKRKVKVTVKAQVVGVI